MTITPDDDRPIDPYAELVDDDVELGDLAEDRPVEGVAADLPDSERPVPLDDES